jgi:hypothetical protein
LIVLDGTGAGATAGLRLGTGNRVRGLVIVNFQAAGISLVADGGSNRIHGNYIGVNADGTTAGPNLVGIQSFSGNNLIGGSIPADRNVISGNVGAGITAQGFDFPANLIQGNYIGTNAAGTAAVGNGAFGISLNWRTQVGGTGAGQGNLISGNSGGGIALGNDDNQSTFQGNLIGTNAAGTAAIPNIGPGLSISDTEDNLIGGLAPGARNVISGNTGDGIVLTGDASATTVQGNLIGTNAAGTAALGNGGSGVLIQSTFSTRLGGNVPAARNVISGNAVDGVRLIDASGNIIQGNYIGLTADGTADLGNVANGINLTDESRNTQIGGAGAGNVISGNDSNGILISADSHDNFVRGNLIGTNAAGTAPVGNGCFCGAIPTDFIGSGVLVNGPANEIGGSAAGEGNLISGNGVGVSVSGASAIGTVIEGNRIGTNAAGDASIGNRWGIFNSDAPGTRIGGTGALDGNVISGSSVDGIAVTLALSTAIVIEGNRIGTNAAGDAAIGNTQNGISVRFDAEGVTIGGIAAGAGNLISGNNSTGVSLETDGNAVVNNSFGTDASLTGPLGNGSSGLRITGSNTSISGNVFAFNVGNGIDASGAGNAILLNSIFENGGLGIDQSGGGVTPNDAPDDDGVQNFPVLTSALVVGGTTTITGSLQSTANTTFQIRFFVSPTCDTSGNGEGQTQFGTLDEASTNVDGNLIIDVSFGVALTEGHAVTATARNLATNDTSEFSACVTVNTPAPEPDMLARLLGFGSDGWQPFQAAKGRLSLLKPPARVRDEPLLVALGLE